MAKWLNNSEAIKLKMRIRQKHCLIKVALSDSWKGDCFVQRSAHKCTCNILQRCESARLYARLRSFCSLLPAVHRCRGLEVKLAQRCECIDGDYSCGH